MRGHAFSPLDYAHLGPYGLPAFPLAMAVCRRAHTAVMVNGLLAGPSPPAGGLSVVRRQPRSALRCGPRVFLDHLGAGVIAYAI